MESEGWEAPSDPCQLMPQTGGEDAFHFLHNKVQGGKQSAEESFCEDSHKFRKLMCQEGQHGCEGAQSSSEEDEEGKFLLWVN